MNIKSKIDKYFQLEQEIHKYFGYEENWVVIPMDPKLNMYWFITDNYVNYSTKKKFNDDSCIYSGSIYTQRFLSKHVYETEDYTMVCVDTHCDGNKFLMIFDNKKRITAL